VRRVDVDPPRRYQVLFVRDPGGRGRHLELDARRVDAVTAPRTRIVRHPEQVKFAKESVAYGLLNFGYAVERVDEAERGRPGRQPQLRARRPTSAERCGARTTPSSSTTVTSSATPSTRTSARCRLRRQARRRDDPLRRQQQRIRRLRRDRDREHARPTDARPGARREQAPRGAAHRGRRSPARRAMTTAPSPDWVAFARDLLEELKPATPLADVPVDADRSERLEPPFILLGEAPGSAARPLDRGVPAGAARAAIGREHRGAGGSRLQGRVGSPARSRAARQARREVVEGLRRDGPADDRGPGHQMARCVRGVRPLHGRSIAPRGGGINQ
jgi:hypothetical protein